MSRRDFAKGAARRAERSRSSVGVATLDTLFPEERIAAIVFINTWGGNPAQITRHLLEEAPNF